MIRKSDVRDQHLTLSPTYLSNNHWLVRIEGDERFASVETVRENFGPDPASKNARFFRVDEYTDEQMEHVIPTAAQLARGRIYSRTNVLIDCRKADLKPNLVRVYRTIKGAVVGVRENYLRLLGDPIDLRQPRGKGWNGKPLVVADEGPHFGDLAMPHLLPEIEWLQVGESEGGRVVRTQKRKAS